MELKKSSLKYSKYILIFGGIFIIISLSLISARIIGLSQNEVDIGNINKETLESVSNKLKETFTNSNENLISKSINSGDGGLFVFLGQRGFYNDLPQSGGQPMFLRIYNYIFNGEVIYWKVLVVNIQGGANEINDVYTSYGESQGVDNDKWSSCILGEQPVDGTDIREYNARILEERLTEFNSNIMAVYDCYFVTGNRDNMYGKYWITVEARNMAGNKATMDENEYWFINPILGITTNNILNFNEADSGEIIYSNSINIQNSGDPGSGVYVFLDISGEDLQASDENSLCNGNNFFSLENIYYYAENYQFTTFNNSEADSEGFVVVPYNDNPIMGNFSNLRDYYVSNILWPQSNIPFKLRLNVPENCHGQFSGKIKITGWEPANPKENVTLEIPIDLTINHKEPNLEFSSSQINLDSPLPGTKVYSQNIEIANNDIPVNLYISGTDFYDSSSSGARCPDTNQLRLGKLEYYAENGDYSTKDDPRADSDGYIPISYGIVFNDPSIPFYDSHELIQNSNASLPAGDFNKYPSNILEQGNIIHLKFRLNVPIPCNGRYDTGSIYIWARSQDGIIKGYGLSINANVVNDPPQVFKCGNTSYLDDATEPGRISEDGEELIERRTTYVYEGDELFSWKYLFEGEQIKWKVLVMDLNSAEKIKDVYVTIGSSIGVGNDIEVNCGPLSENLDYNTCQLGELRNNFTEFNPKIMKYYDCVFTVETADSMYGQYWAVPEAEDNDGNLGIMNESEFVWTNPVIALSLNGDIGFENLTPGKIAYSNEISIGNDVDEGSGVVLDMFISGTDFTSSEDFSHCPEKQTLGLDRFSYKAEIENYSTMNDLGIGGNRHKDNEGYVNMGYGIGFNNPNPFYNGFEIIQDGKEGAYYLGNQVREGQDMNVRFKIDVPKNCTGSFDNGNIYFWGEAI